jgi:hypothetical protein
MEESCCGLILRHFPSIFLAGLTETTKNVSEDSWPLDRDLNLGPPKYKAKVLATQPQHLV